jgi:hypothetical protein
VIFNSKKNGSMKGQPLPTFFAMKTTRTPLKNLAERSRISATLIDVYVGRIPGALIPPFSNSRLLSARI